jgi:hypothetical protein
MVIKVLSCKSVNVILVVLEEFLILTPYRLKSSVPKLILRKYQSNIHSQFFNGKSLITNPF